MILCRVIGSALQQMPLQRVEASDPPSAHALLIVQPVDMSGRRLGGEMVAEARVRTNVGDLVLVDPDRRAHDPSGHGPVVSVAAAAVAVVEGFNDQHRSS